MRGLWIVASALLSLVLINCSDTPAYEAPTPEARHSLGISLSRIQSEFEPDDFEWVYEQFLLEDGRPATTVSKYPSVAMNSGELLEFVLIGPEEDLTEAIVLFATTEVFKGIDPIDAVDAGRFIDMVAPSANGVAWMREGYRSGWKWEGFGRISGDKGDVHVQAERHFGYIRISITPR